MKKIIVITMLFLITATAQTPNWTSLKETNIPVIGNNAYDIFTNAAGNHIIVQANDEIPKKLNYYRMKVDGSWDLDPLDIETAEVISPSISGDQTRIYIVYRINTPAGNNKIKTKYSNNGGASWSYISDLNTTGNADFIECEFSRGKLHVTFLVGTTVYYNYYDTELPTPGWRAQNFTVSDPGANPRIRINPGGSVDTVYFVFNPSANTSSWRRYIIGEPSLRPINSIQTLGGNVNLIGFAVDNKCLYLFSKLNIGSTLILQIKRIWNNTTPSGGWTSNGNTSTSKLFSTTTIDNIPYTAAWDQTIDPQPPYRLSRIGFNGTFDLVEDLIYQNQNLSPVDIVNLWAAGNDVHVIWKDNLGTNNGNNLRYKYYDDYPTAPKNLTINRSANNHPLLSWSANPEPDIFYYKIYRSNQCNPQWLPIGQTLNPTTFTYEDETLSYCTLPPPQQCINQCIYQYKITAVDNVDNGSLESNYSNIVSAALVPGSPPEKSGFSETTTLEAFDYKLGQNYPNPFNPTTTVDYSIKVYGLVTLKVYDILGMEVASLVNETKEAGSYSVTFNATDLSSGIYFYKLQAGQFTSTKKLILLK